MPNCILATTEHVIIEWWPGKQSNGLFIRAAGEDDHIDAADFDEESIRAGNRPESFIERRFIPGLISQLRDEHGDLTLLSRVSYPNAVPTLHQRSQRRGGVPGVAYYVPLTVLDAHRFALADALEFACSKENVAAVEKREGSDSYTVLDGDYLEDGVWEFARRYPEIYAGSNTPPSEANGKPYYELPAVAPIPPTKKRIQPIGIHDGDKRKLLREAHQEHRCDGKPCKAGYKVKAGETYLEYRQGFVA